MAAMSTARKHDGLSVRWSACVLHEEEYSSSSFRPGGGEFEGCRRKLSTTTRTLDRSSPVQPYQYQAAARSVLEQLSRISLENPPRRVRHELRGYGFHGHSAVSLRTFRPGLHPQVLDERAADLGTDWIGKRVYYPKVEDVTAGAKAPWGVPRTGESGGTLRMGSSTTTPTSWRTRQSS